MKKFTAKIACVFLSSLVFLAACSHKSESVDSKQGYLGHWKVTNAQGEIYYVTLNPDGTGSSTREGGELGKWQLKADHIEVEWNPKTLKLYFNSGSAKPILKTPSQNPGNSGASVAEKVDQIPE